MRNIKEAVLQGATVELSVQTRRIKCRECGMKTGYLSWLEPYSRITKRLKSRKNNLVERQPFGFVFHQAVCYVWRLGFKAFLEIEKA